MVPSLGGLRPFGCAEERRDRSKAELEVRARNRQGAAFMALAGHGAHFGPRGSSLAPGKALGSLGMTHPRVHPGAVAPGLDHNEASPNSLPARTKGTCCLTPAGLASRIPSQIAQPGERPGSAGHRRGKSRPPCRPGTKLSGSKDPGWPAPWKVVRHRRGKPRRGESLRSWTEGRTLAWRAPLCYLWNREAGMAYPQDLKFTKNDEWIRVEGDQATIGISDYAQQQLSDIVFFETTVGVGDAVAKGATCATVESVKAAAEVYLPVAGTVTAVNEALPTKPEQINTDPHRAAWIGKIKI